MWPAESTTNGRRIQNEYDHALAPRPLESETKMKLLTSGASNATLPKVAEVTSIMGPKNQPPKFIDRRKEERRRPDYHKIATTASVVIVSIVAVVGILASVGKFWMYTVDKATNDAALSNRVGNIESYHQKVSERQKQIQDNEWTLQQGQAVLIDELAPNPRAKARIKAILQNLKPPVQIPQALLREFAESPLGGHPNE
jgi:hypothetical protein